MRKRKAVLSLEPALWVNWPVPRFIANVKRLRLRHRLGKRDPVDGTYSWIEVRDYPLGSFDGLIGLSSNLDGGGAKPR